jgi:hypothetical protein
LPRFQTSSSGWTASFQRPIRASSISATDGKRPPVKGAGSLVTEVMVAGGEYSQCAER